MHEPFRTTHRIPVHRRQAGRRAGCRPARPLCAYDRRDHRERCTRHRPIQVAQACQPPRPRQPAWAAMAPVERGRILGRAAAIILERNDELARLETLDTGKPIQETLVADWPSGAAALEYFAGLAATLTGQMIPLGAGLGLYPPRGAWRLRGHRCLELSQPDRLLEGRACLGHGQHHGLQTVRGNAARGLETGGNLHRGRDAAGRLQRGAGPRCGRCRAGHRPQRGQGVPDRFGAHRPPRLCGRRGRNAACHDGAGRQVAPDRL